MIVVTHDFDFSTGLEVYATMNHCYHADSFKWFRPLGCKPLAVPSFCVVVAHTPHAGSTLCAAFVACVVPATPRTTQGSTQPWPGLSQRRKIHERNQTGFDMACVTTRPPLPCETRIPSLGPSHLMIDSNSV